MYLIMYIHNVAMCSRVYTVYVQFDSSRTRIHFNTCTEIDDRYPYSQCIIRMAPVKIVVKVKNVDI